MLLTISAEGSNSNILSFLLHKHPDKLQTAELSVGKAHVFYPEYSEEKTTAALLLEIDPVGMVRNAKNFTGKDFLLGQYVNDRPYVASSFMSSAIAKVFSSALNGNCKEHTEYVDEALSLTVKISVLPAPRGGELLIKNIFEPLGYSVEAERHILDTKFTEWGYGKYFTLTLKNKLPLKDLLSHLYVLIPVLDNEKHYFITQDEVDKLLQKGRGWLENHPSKDLVVSRYLINIRSLVRSAFDTLAEEDAVQFETEEESDSPLQKEKKERLHDQRLNAVAEKLKESGAASVIDLGCGDGKLIRLLLKEKQFEKIAGMDVSYSELTKCKERLHWEDMPPKQKERLNLFQSSLMYRDKRFSGFDAAAVVEVIEHLDENRLPAFEKAVFKFAQPNTVVLTTPNSEYNVQYENLANGKMRHTDHRFEWTRKEFEAWAKRVADENNYSVEFFPVGEEEKNIGAPSQMAVFKYAD
ncbi:3' terminal RNA ribose 2'-O-methyltransferase Hen1 [Treponema sp. OMZ 788]|uniref:3' terminal RNA ribose 2'-O-methyltransferase Hen1 n=1 Tax=Treponema sp. OMZ 788 TaxID=2563664 RepID=UPI0020A3FF32|nr:3' terminal RNA ribose 2'-O-methyltransferase Hen1 [Treponema sp. OMZ 788]UTC64072.1 3' terminal RNA ribose 2'-O-methyltransferase Hen1 [Treponema sp. OMZ 788]